MGVGPITPDSSGGELMGTQLAAHLADTSDAHDASAISFSATGNLSSTDVQAAIAELPSQFAPANAEWRAASVTGVKGDYTGRFGASGTGTDDHAVIQAALDAASDPVGSYWYAYLQRRGVTVKLPPGIYLISAPSSGPSLNVPEGVRFDCSEAMMFFDYPSSARGDWCGILINNTASLVAPMFMAPSGRNSAPAAPGSSDTALLYDGVRLLGNDNVRSSVTAISAAEIKGFAGASIRSIGTWVTRIAGPLMLTSQLGYVASNWPENNVYGYDHPADLAAVLSGVRLHTDLYLDGPYFVGTSGGGLLGVVTGDPSTPHALDLTRSGGFQCYFRGVVFEHFAAAAVDMTGGLIDFDNCAFEEVGLINDEGMARLNNVFTLSIRNHRVNYTGASVPGPSGDASPYNNYVWNISSIRLVNHEGGYVRNTYNASMGLFSASASLRHWVQAPYTDSNSLAAGPMFRAGGVSQSQNPDRNILALGSETIPRDMSQVSTSLSTTSGTLHLCYWTPEVSFTAASLSIFCASTARGATPTLQRFGLYQIDSAGNGTLVASTVSDTALMNSTFTMSSKALITPITISAGERYAIGYIVVTGAATPTLGGLSPLTSLSAQSPRLSASLAGQTDLPVSFVDSALAASGRRFYAQALPA